MRGTITAGPREAEGPQVDELYQHDAVCCRGVAMHPREKAHPCFLLRNPRPFTLPVLNKAAKI